MACTGPGAGQRLLQRGRVINAGAPLKRGLPRQRAQALKFEAKLLRSRTANMVASRNDSAVQEAKFRKELEEKLAYSRDPSQRYAVGPVPQTLGGRRALDFVLDNRTLKDFNRTLLFDIRLSAIRK